MFSATLREWKRKIEQLQQRWRGVRQENERLRKENEALQREKEQLLDEVISAPLPKRCSCGGQVAFDRMEFQYQQEIVRKTFWQRFDIAIGHCKKCQKRWQGRDPRQTSDALGAAQVQLVPEALALGVRMNKGLGMPHADVAAVLQDGFQLQVNRSTICRAAVLTKRLPWWGPITRVG